MRRAFADFDGTWTNHPEIWEQVEAVVTGESWENYNEFMNDWVGPRRPVFFNPVEDGDLSTLTIVSHKSNIINKCNVTKFFEDQQEQVDMLQLLCPNTEIVHVKGEMTYI